MFEKFAVDSGSSPAMLVNAVTTAKILRYPFADPAETKVIRMAVCKPDGIGRVFYATKHPCSAVFSDYCGHKVGETLIPINQGVLVAMEKFMGESVMKEARASESEAHQFVRAMLAAEGGKLALAIAR